MLKSLALAALAVSAACALSACGGVTEGANGQSVTADGSDATKDVAVKSCKAGAYGALDAAVTIKNSTAAKATYAITVEALDAKGARLAEANGAANAVAAKGTATVSLVGTIDGGAKIATCKVAQVTRI